MKVATDIQMDLGSSNRADSKPASPDINLLERALNGSDFAFQQLVLLEQQSVRVFLSRYIFCSEQIEDIAQEVFLAAYQKISTFRRESTFSTWLLAIARNKAIEFLRKDSRRKKTCCSLPSEHFIMKQLSKLEDTGEIQLHQQRIEALRGCLTQLPDDSKGLIDSFYFKKCSSATIAGNRKCKDGSIRMKLMRIRRKLAACISYKMSDN